LVVIRLKQHLPETLLPLDEVRDSVVASVLHERAMQQASGQADEIFQQVQNGADMAATAEAHGLELQALEAVQRDNTQLPSDLIAQIFQMQAPEEELPRDAVVPLANGYAVVQLERVVDGDVSAIDLEKVKNYRRRIANATANAEALGFLRNLRQQSEIEVHEERL